MFGSALKTLVSILVLTASMGLLGTFVHNTRHHRDDSTVEFPASVFDENHNPIRPNSFEEWQKLRDDQTLQTWRKMLKENGGKQFPHMPPQLPLHIQFQLQEEFPEVESLEPGQSAAPLSQYNG